MVRFSIGGSPLELIRPIMTIISTKKYGIIGCGMMGHEHVANLNLLDGAKVCGVYDPVPELAQSVSEKADGAAVYNSIKDIASADLDALVTIFVMSKTWRRSRSIQTHLYCVRNLSIRTKFKKHGWTKWLPNILRPFGLLWSIVICRPSRLF